MQSVQDTCVQTTMLDGFTQKDLNKLKYRALQFKDFYDPDDLVQDALLKALENQHKVKGGYMTVSYVNSFMIHLAMNKLTVENGRGRGKGRRALLKEYQYEQKRLNSYHGKRTMPAKESQAWA